MPKTHDSKDSVRLRDAPEIDGLIFRRFQGEKDYPSMVPIMNRSWEADKIDLITSLGEVAYGYQHLVNCDPYQDMLFAEVDGKMIGFSRVWWNQRTEGLRTYEQSAYLLPEWRGTKIRRTMFRYDERRLFEIALKHPLTGFRYYEARANDEENDWKSLILTEGYRPARHFFEMVRPDLEDIPDLPLPREVEVRPVQPQHYRSIWEAEKEAGRDEPDYSETKFNEENYERWVRSPDLSPNLWQIAWHGDEVAGMVRSFISEDENRKFGRSWGHTEHINVRRSWRKQGLASALIARSLKILKDNGMMGATLDVEAENPSGALRLYEKLGFRKAMQFTVFRKPLG